MPHLLHFTRPLARLSFVPSTTIFRGLTTQATSKHIDPSTPFKPTTLKSHLKNCPATPEVPTVNSPIPPPSKTLEEILASGIPYFVRRTPYTQLPVYKRWRGGGTLEEVIIKKIEGDRRRLAKELREVLGCDPSHVKINPITKHIEVKGDHYDRIRSWLVQKGF